MVTSLRPVLAAVFALLFFTASPAIAHDELISTDPADGESVATAPEALTLTFSGQISDVGPQVEVTDGSGESQLEGPPQVEGTDVVQQLQDLAPGDYAVLWRVTSQDGHPISGEFSFTVEAAADEGAEQSGDPSTEPADTSEEETSEAPATAEEETAAPSTSAATEAADSDAGIADEASGSGLPVWAWIVIGAGVLALIGVVGSAMARRRN